MNIVFWVIVIIIAIFAWITLSVLFKHIGGFILKTKQEIKNSINKESEKNNYDE